MNFIFNMPLITVLLCTFSLSLTYLTNSIPYSFSQLDTDFYWTRGVDMPRPTTEISSAILDNGIYIIGGYDEEGKGVSMVEMYNVTTDTWAKNIAQLPISLHHTSSASYQGKIYVAGGYTGDWKASDRLFIYNPQTNEWTI